MDAIAAQWDARIRVSVQKPPAWMRPSLDWLLEPSHRWFRVPTAIALLIGGVFAPVPVISVCRLPTGFVLLGEDLPWRRSPVERRAQFGRQNRRRRKWHELARRPRIGATGPLPTIGNSLGIRSAGCGRNRARPC